MKNGILQKIVQQSKQGKKMFALLVDPDKFEGPETITIAAKNKADLILVGGSLITNGNVENCIETIKKNCSIPVLLFPGNHLQISKKADGILFLSLISGRNPDLLIGQHVLAAPQLKKSKLEILPTGYMLIESGKITSAQYMSGTMPIPRQKNDIALCTALAGEMLGLKLIYMDGGSGAEQPVSASMIKKVKNSLSIPLIIGGGINTVSKAVQACEAGADVIVVGNAAEKDPSLLKGIIHAVHQFKPKRP